MFGCVGLWLLVMLGRLNRRSESKPTAAPIAKVSAKQWIQLLLTGTTMGLTGILYYASLITIPASIAIVLLFQFTWIGVLIEALLERRIPERMKLIALLPLFIGTLLAGGILQEQSFTFTWAGLGLGLGASISYALFILFSGRAAVEVRPMVRSSIIATGAMLITFIVFPPVFLWNGTLFNGLWVWVLGLALLGIVVPTFLFTVGVPKIGGGWASILSAAELPMAVTLSSFVLREHVSWLQWMGVAVIILGIIIPEAVKGHKGQHPA